MKKTKHFFSEPLNHEGVCFVPIFIALVMALVMAFYMPRKNTYLCFPKSQLTELEKSIKTNKLLRGTYDDL